MKKELCISFGEKMGVAYSQGGTEIFSSTVRFRDSYSAPDEFKPWMKQMITMAGNPGKVFYLSHCAAYSINLSVLLIDTCHAIGTECIEVSKSDIIKAAALDMALENSNDDNIVKYFSSYKPKSANEAYAIALLHYVF